MPSGRRLLPGSLRFRLTAWYALLLAGVLLVLGLSILQLTENRLRAEVDQRVEKTALDMKTYAEYKIKEQVDEQGWASVRRIQWSIGSFASRGLLIQVCDASNQLLVSSESAPTDWVLLAAKQPTGKQKPPLQTIQVDGMETRAVRYPFNTEDDDGRLRPVAAVIVGERLASVHETLASLRQILLITSVAGLALAILGGWLLADRALRPVNRITATAASIANGAGTAASLATRLTVSTTGDELARLSGTFNAMLDRIQTAFIAQQRFVADASHELRTPLTAIRGNVEVLGRQIAALRPGNDDDGDLNAAVADMKRESARMGRLLDDLLLLARSDAPEGVPHHPREVRLDGIARDAVHSAAALALDKAVSVLAPRPVFIQGDPDRLVQLLLILLENALRHTPAGGRITVEIPEPTGGLARLIVRDDGEGIAPEHLPHLFDRFYRADGARGRATGGTGLGLAIAEAIAHSHGGQITVSSEPDQGSTFTVTLRTAPSPIPQRPASLPLPTPLPAPPRLAESIRGQSGTTSPTAQ